MDTIMIPGYEDDDIAVIMFECDDREVKFIGHDPTSNRLCVRFSNGLLQVYHGVGANLFERFCTAPSKSAFWETYIQNDLESAPSPNGWRIGDDLCSEIASQPIEWLGRTG
jgi:hypothetical protein